MDREVNVREKVKFKSKPDPWSSFLCGLTRVRQTRSTGAKGRLSSTCFGAWWDLLSLRNL